MMKNTKPRRQGRRRAATVLAAMGVLVMSSGAALMVSAGSAQAAQGGHIPVNVCHATDSDTHPYNFITVDADSTKFQGHLMHRNSPNKIWKTDGTFNGVPHSAGDAKPDLIASYTDANGDFQKLDGTITADSCKDQATVPDEATADVDFEDPSCANGGVADFDATGDNVTFAITDGSKAPDTDIEVTATADQGAQFSGGGTTQVFTHHYGPAVDPNAPPCVAVSPPDVATAAVSFTDPTCANLNDASYTPTGQNVSFVVTSGSAAAGQDIEVTATADQGAEFADHSTTQVFTHHFTDAVDLDAEPCVDVSTPENPPVVSPPAITPTVVEAGLVSDVQRDVRGTQGLVLIGAGMLMLVLAGGLARSSAKA